MSWALCLSGGAALGAVQVPVIEALLAAHGPPSLVAGTSVGAVHALLVGEGRHAELRPIWAEEVAQKGRSWFMRTNLDMWNGLFSLAPLRAQVEHRRAGKRLKIKTCVGVTDLARGEHELIELNPLDWADRVDAALCSSQQPMVHERERFKGRWLSDGGVTHVLPPISPEGFDLVVAIFCSPVGEARDRPTLKQAEVSTALEQGRASLDLLIDCVVQNDFARVKRYANPRAQYSRKVDVYAPSSWGVIGPSLDASEELVVARLAEGARMASAPVWRSP